jgi:hypothetical protein
MNTEMSSAGLRPSLSPMRPKTTPPTGRAAKPMANTPNAASSDATGSSAGKKSAPMIGARYPYTAKSYHSSTLPTVPATMFRRAALACDVLAPFVFDTALSLFTITFELRLPYAAEH